MAGLMPDFFAIIEGRAGAQFMDTLVMLLRDARPHLFRPLLRGEETPTVWWQRPEIPKITFALTKLPSCVRRGLEFGDAGLCAGRSLTHGRVARLH